MFWHCEKAGEMPFDCNFYPQNYADQGFAVTKNISMSVQEVNNNHMPQLSAQLGELQIVVERGQAATEKQADYETALSDYKAALEAVFEDPEFGAIGEQRRKICPLCGENNWYQQSGLWRCHGCGYTEV